jgi:HAD superfamily hydrolase (TIGR01484 family)
VKGGKHLVGSNQYDGELTRLDETYRAALRADVRKLKAAFGGASEASIIAVGSGGSFTVASLIAALHEFYTGRVSRPSTPLEIICNPTLAASSPVFFVSAEGKNPDVLEGLERARLYSARAIHVLTNRTNTPLSARAAELTDISVHEFALVEKDGFLATNSLLFDAIVVVRAYSELDNEKGNLPATINDLKLIDNSIKNWKRKAETFVQETVKRRGLIIIHSPLMRPVAADLESKLSEAALLYCQVVDLRSFAHGRHLWLAERSSDCTILAIIDCSLKKLWDRTRALLPEGFPVLAMEFGPSNPADILTGLVAAMHFVASVAKNVGKDAGRAQVPDFGRELHYLPYEGLIELPDHNAEREERSKYEVLGARWPSPKLIGKIERASNEFRSDLKKQTFRSVVFDYDGTLCRSQQIDAAPSEVILEHVRRLIDGGVLVGIASGRGGSIQEHLRERLPESDWSKVLLGLYNGGWLADVGAEPPGQIERETDEFLSHVIRIVGKLKDLGVPIETIRATHPYQVSIRFRDGVRPDTMWFVIADALRQAGLDLMKVVHSKHSVDVLNSGVNKSHLVAKIIQEFKIDPYHVLTMGDEGAWPGNDASLLEHRFSLSVDIPSRRLDRGWKLAPAHRRDVDATLWY